MTVAGVANYTGNLDYYILIAWKTLKFDTNTTLYQHLFIFSNSSSSLLCGEFLCDYQCWAYLAKHYSNFILFFLVKLCHCIFCLVVSSARGCNLKFSDYVKVTCPRNVLYFDIMGSVCLLSYQELDGVFISYVSVHSVERLVWDMFAWHRGCR